MATKARKQEVISELKTFFENGQMAIVADLSGFTVAEITQLRRKLDKADAKCRVGKNTLVKIAVEGSSLSAVKELAHGPSSIVVGYKDLAAPAKVTVEYLKSLKKGEIRGGVLEGKVISVNEVKNLANLPSKEQLLASIMGGLDSGARNIAGLLEASIRDIAVLIEEVAKKNNAA